MYKQLFIRDQSTWLRAWLTAYVTYRPSINNNLHSFSSYTATHKNYKINPSVRQRHKHLLLPQFTEGRKHIYGTSWWELRKREISRQIRTIDVSVPVKCQKNCDSPSTTHIKSAFTVTLITTEIISRVQGTAVGLVKGYWRAAEYEANVLVFKYIKQVYIKGNVHPITGHESTEGEWGYSSTLSLTSALCCR